MANGDVSIKLGVINPAEWLAHNADIPLPLQQHPTYGQALETFGATARQITIFLGADVIGRALLIERRFFGLLGYGTIFRGPVWQSADLSNGVKTAVYKQLRALSSPWRWKFLCAMPEEPYSEGAKLTFTEAGFRRVMSGFSTSWVDLRPPEGEIRANLKGKWRNQLVRSENRAVDISIGGRKAHQYSWLLEKEAEQRSKRRYQATPLGLVPAYVAAASAKNQSGILSVTALSGRRKIAGALFLHHGNSATYHIGWTGDEARSLNAQNRVLWEGMMALKKQGISFLDLGGLDTAYLSGIARFKLGLGGAPITLSGAYI